MGKQTASALIERGEKTVSLKMGTNIALVNNQQVNLDCAAEMIKGRILVPVRFISETFGAKVVWNDKAKTVEVLYKS